jgi:hypothetical protein
MKYLNGYDIMIGDLVDLGGGWEGIVICCFDDNLGAPGFEGWSNFLQDSLKEGLFVYCKQAGFIHYPKLDEEFILIKRQPNFDWSIILSHIENIKRSSV